MTYDRDALGRIHFKTETIQGVTTQYEYLYDLAGRLDQVYRDGILVSDYDYGPNSNRVAYTDELGVTVTGTYDDQGRMLSYAGATYTYTDNGELATKTEGGLTTSYTYDMLGNLTRVVKPDGTLIEYVIDGRNRRVGKKVDGVLVQGFLYADQLNPIAELDGEGNMVSLFVYGSRGNVPEYLVRAGETYRIISDHLGSPRLVVDVTTGAVVQRMDYDEFGRVLANSNPGFQPFGFAGGLWDWDVELVRFGVRDYDPVAGRWTSKVPMTYRTYGKNNYEYCHFDPVNYFDITGLDPVDDAARAALNDAINPSVKENKEYGGWIYEEDGEYRYTEPVPLAPVEGGKPGEHTLPDRPKGKKIVACYHTHGKSEKLGESYEKFSDEDKTWSQLNEMPIYLGTPTGAMKRFDWNSDPQEDTGFWRLDLRQKLKNLD